MAKVLDYIDFFEEFAKNHVDVAHLSPVDTPLMPAQSTVQDANATVRFKATFMERVFNTLANNTDAKYKAFLFLEFPDAQPWERRGEVDFNHFKYNATVTVVQEVEEDSEAEENKKIDICFGVVQDLAHYLAQSAAYEDGCHPLLQDSDIREMRLLPEFHLFNGNAHGYTLEFTIVQFSQDLIRAGKFRSGFLSDRLSTSPSPLGFSPAQVGAGGTLTVSGVSLESTEEVRLCPVSGDAADCIRLGPGVLTYVAPNLEAALPADLPAGNYTVEAKTDQGSWIAGGTLAVL